MVVWCIPMQIVSCSYGLNQRAAVLASASSVNPSWGNLWLRCSGVFCWKCSFLLADLGTPRKYSCVYCCSTLGVVINYMGEIEKQGDVPAFHSVVVSVACRVLGHQGKESPGLFLMLHFRCWKFSWRISVWYPDLAFSFRKLLSLEQSLVFESRSWDLINTSWFSCPGKSPCLPLKEIKVQKLQESPCFSAQLGNPLLTAKRGIQKSKASSAGTVLTETHRAFVKNLCRSQQQCRHIQGSFYTASAPGAVWPQQNRAHYGVNYCVLCNGCYALGCYG